MVSSSGSGNTATDLNGPTAAILKVALVPQGVDQPASVLFSRHEFSLQGARVRSGLAEISRMAGRAGWAAYDQKFGNKSAAGPI
jgi:hypothetical protein